MNVAMVDAIGSNCSARSWLLDTPCTKSVNADNASFIERTAGNEKLMGRLLSGVKADPAQMMRVNLFRPVHVKTLASQQRRALLTGRKLLQEKAIAIENDIYEAAQVMLIVSCRVPRAYSITRHGPTSRSKH